MANNIYFRPLTPLESFSMTQMFTLKMAQWNHSVKHDILGPISARIIGCALVAFTALADALMHTALTIGKCISGLSLFAFQFCINIPQDLNLGSSLIHLNNTMRAVFHSTTLPFLCLLDPDRAYHMVKTYHDGRLLKVKILRDQLHNEEKTLAKLKEGFDQKERLLKDLKRNMVVLEGHIEKLNQELQVTQDQMKERKNEVEDHNNKLEELEKKINQLKIDKENDINALFIANKDIEKKVQELKDLHNKKNVEENLAGLEQKADVEHINNKFGNLKVEGFQLNNKIAENLFRIEEEAEAESLNSEIQNLKIKIQNQKNKIVEAENPIKNAQEKSDELKIKIGALENEKAALQEKIIIKENEKKALEDENKELRQKADKLMKDDNDFKELLSLSNQANVKLQAQLKEAEEALIKKNNAKDIVIKRVDPVEIPWLF